jgi:putative MATE family efflux protein
VGLNKSIASHAESVEEKYQEMTSAPIGHTLAVLSAPAIVSNLVSTIYNLADTYFIGQISTSASGAIGIAYATMTLIQGIGFFFGQGTGNALSRELGAKEPEKASQVATVGVALAFLCGLLVAVFGHVFLRQICLIAGSTDTILPYAMTYIGIILAGAPWMATSLVLNCQLRFAGYSFFSMIGLVSGALLNFVLAPLLIFVCGLGIAGAGLATITCEAVSFTILLVMIHKTGILKLSRANFKPTAKMLRVIANGGFPSLCRQVVFGFATVTLNSAARPYGDAAIAAIAIVQRIMSLGNCVQIGIGQGFQPLCGYNYGAHNFARVKRAFRDSVLIAIAIIATFCAVVYFAAVPIVTLMRDDPKVIYIAVRTLRYQCFSLPLTGLAMLTNFLLQTTGKMWRATFLGVARLGIILAPVVLVLSHLFGLAGVECAQAVSDTITMLISLPMAYSILHELTLRQEAIDAQRKAGQAQG